MWSSFSQCVSLEGGSGIGGRGSGGWGWGYSRLRTASYFHDSVVRTETCNHMQWHVFPLWLLNGECEFVENEIGSRRDGRIAAKEENAIKRRQFVFISSFYLYFKKLIFELLLEVFTNLHCGKFNNKITRISNK